MQNDEKILKILEAMQSAIAGVKTDVSHLSTGLDAVKAGVEDVQTKVAAIEAKQKEQPTKQDVETTVDAAKAEIKADLLLLESKVIKKIQSHERRITNIENQEQIEHPEKH